MNRCSDLEALRGPRDNVYIFGRFLEMVREMSEGIDRGDRSDQPDGRQARDSE